MDDNTFREMLARMAGPQAGAPGQQQQAPADATASPGTAPTTMDDATFNKHMAILQARYEAEHGTVPATAPGTAPPSGTTPGSMPATTAPDAGDDAGGGDPESFIFEGGHPEDRQYTPAPPTGHADPNDPTKGGIFPAGGQYADPRAPANAEAGLSDPSTPFVEAPIAGSSKFVIETAKALYAGKDFVAGEP